MCTRISRPRCPHRQILDVQDAFSTIYKDGTWGEDGKGSGQGSTLTTAFIVASTIRLVMGMYSLTSLLDAPCGMMVWQEPLLAALSDDIPEFKYFGTDIVPSVIESHRKNFKEYSNMQFAVKDVSKDELPQGYDLIFCREALQHLPCEVAVDALENFSKSDAKFLLTTSHNNHTENIDIPVGEFYSINLQLAPFNLDRPARVFNEHGDKLGSPDQRYLNMYLIDYLKAQDYIVMKKNCAKLPAMETQ